MIDRICISINNRCNLSCKYCHFQEKGMIVPSEMNVPSILDNIKSYAKSTFKIGFVGNGEPFLDWPLLKSCIAYIEDSPYITAYTITNGTIHLPDSEIRFLEDHAVNVGFSIDGYKELHNLYRCGSFEQAMVSVEQFKRVTGHYPTFNATVGKESLKVADKVIGFFSAFGTRVTFSRMIGRYGISLEEYHEFLDKAERSIPVRRGGKDCTMYGGQCGAGLNNFFFANGKVYYCGNCIDLPALGESGLSLFDLEKLSLNFDRSHCYKESL